MEEIKRLAGLYFGQSIGQALFEAMFQQAIRKLEWIINREGDANGERRKPYYIAQLVAEELQSELLTERCRQNYEDKKRAVAKANSPLNQQPHYSTVM